MNPFEMKCQDQEIGLNLFLSFYERKDGIQVQERKKARSIGTQIKGSLTNAATVHYTN